MLLGLVSSRSHGSYCFFMIVPSMFTLLLHFVILSFGGDLPLVHVVLFISSFLVIL